VTLDLAVGPAYRIVTPRLVIRCWSPADASAAKRAIDSSLGELKPWLPWAAAEPQPVQSKIELFRTFRGWFDLGQDFLYGIFDPREAEVLGGTGLHRSVGQEAREIGYWIATSHAGKGLATEAVSALCRIGFELDALDRIEIHCDPDNARSVAIPARLGFVHEATLRRRHPGDHPRDRTMVWTLLHEEYEASEIRRLRVDAFDGAGNQLLIDQPGVTTT
jgi:RimJ/RimL family protein N-acetyltransferase